MEYTKNEQWDPKNDALWTCDVQSNPCNRDEQWCIWACCIVRFYFHSPLLDLISEYLLPNFSFSKKKDPFENELQILRRENAYESTEVPTWMIRTKFKYE